MNPMLQRCAARIAHWRSRSRPWPLQKRIERTLSWLSDVSFVQVGSNDGMSGDPLHDLIIRNEHWRGVFIEPVGRLFEQLKTNYPASDRFAFENVAIGMRRGQMPFYFIAKEKTLADETIPDWCDQLGSFDKQHILKHLGGRLAPYIVETLVDSVPLADVLAKHAISRLDFLHIDTEGFDYEVLKQVDFSTQRPAAILFEQKHLSNDDEQQAARLFAGFRYDLFDFGDDCLAIARG